MFIAKYDPAGSLVWARISGGEHDAAGYEVSTLTDGSALVAGSFELEATFGRGEANETNLAVSEETGLFLAQYSAAGTLDWVIEVGRGASLQLNGMSTLPDGTLFLIGDFQGTAVLGFGTDQEATLVSDGEDGFVVKYSR